MGRTDFIPPQSRAEAEERRAQLIERVQIIQAELSKRNRQDANGVRLGSHDYWNWRAKAVGALVALQSELRQIKRWLAERRDQEKGSEARASSRPIELLRMAYEVLARLEDEGVDFTEDELDTFDQLREFLTTVGVITSTS